MLIYGSNKFKGLEALFNLLEIRSATQSGMVVNSDNFNAQTITALQALQSWLLHLHQAEIRLVFVNGAQVSTYNGANATRFTNATLNAVKIGTDAIRSITDTAEIASNKPYYSQLTLTDQTKRLAALTTI